VPPAVVQPSSPTTADFTIARSSADYSLGPQSSPAFTAARRKQLQLRDDHSFDTVTENAISLESTSLTIDSTSRIDHVADQVVACNRKVDSIAEAMFGVQASLTLVMQRLDRN